MSYACSPPVAEPASACIVVADLMWIARAYIRVNRSTRTVWDFFAGVGTALLVERFFELAGGVWILLSFVVFSLFMGARWEKMPFLLPAVFGIVRVRYRNVRVDTYDDEREVEFGWQTASLRIGRPVYVEFSGEVVERVIEVPANYRVVFQTSPEYWIETDESDQNLRKYRHRITSGNRQFVPGKGTIPVPLRVWFQIERKGG